MTRDWSNLNHDILRLIAGKVKTLEDFPRICAVCSNWESGLEWSNFSYPQLPWLMLPCPHGIGVGGVPRCRCQCRCQCRQSYSVMENKLHQFDFPEAYDKKCVGSSHGWMIMVEDVSPAIFMLNPLTKQRIELPPVTTMLPDIQGFEKEEVGREYIYKDAFSGDIDRNSLKHVMNFFTHKVILSNDPMEEEDCVAVAICGQLEELVFCRIRQDTKWTPVQHSQIPQIDVIYFKGKFYTLDYNGMVGVFDVTNPQITIIHKVPSEIRTDYVDNMYLVVDTTGGLLHISRWRNDYDSFSEAKRDNANGNIDHIDDHHEEDGDVDHDIATFYYRTTKFNVFKLDEEKNVWNEVRDIGDDIIFLGYNQSICYSASEYPECKGNSIYFTDDYFEYRYGLHGGHDIGIFNIDEGCGLIRTMPCFKEDLSFIIPPPVWFTPSVRRVNLG